MYAGEFRGIAHQSCNLKMRTNKRIPVIAHNCSKYDSHLIIQKLGLQKHKKLFCIPSTSESYISFGIGKLHFIDSLRFLPASLDTLVSNLAQEGPNKFPILNAFYTPEQVSLVMRKLSYPYEYMDSMKKFEECELPPKEAYYSCLTGEHISDESYEHARSVWNEFDIKNLGDFQT